jgi:pilus assembly protein CpaF
VTAAEAFSLILPFFPEPVQNLILDDTVSDLMITSGKVFVDRGGTLSEVPDIEIDNDGLDAGVQNIARTLGKDIGKDKPLLDARLPDGSRVAAVYPPNSLNGITLTIRRFNRWFTTDELIACGTLPRSVRDATVNYLLDRKNVLIAGGTGSGKTTLLNSFLNHIPAQERLIIIEKPAELSVSQRNAVRWEATDELPGQPAVTVGQLLVAALRHRPDRIVIGEVRDNSAYELLQAMNTGHSGTLSTIHADSALGALYRLSGLALSAHGNLDHKFVRSETAQAIEYVVYVRKNTDGMRVVRELIRVDRYDSQNDEFIVTTLYAS